MTHEFAERVLHCKPEIHNVIFFYHNFCFVCSQASCFGSRFDHDIHLSGIKKNKKGKLKHLGVLSSKICWIFLSVIVMMHCLNQPGLSTVWWKHYFKTINITFALNKRMTSPSTCELNLLRNSQKSLSSWTPPFLWQLCLLQGWMNACHWKFSLCNRPTN